MSLQTKQTVENDRTVITFKGTIDEDAIFSPNLLQGVTGLTLDLLGVESINSCGVREWVRWVETLPKEAPLVLRNIPKVMVDQINMIAGFLPAHATVESFLTPYFCEACGLQKEFTFSAGKDFNPPDVTFPIVHCDKCKGEMEIDVIESNYFRFLKSIIPQTK